MPGRCLAALFAQDWCDVLQRWREQCLWLCSPLPRFLPAVFLPIHLRRARLKRDGTRAETIFGLSEKWTGPFKSAGESVQSTTGSRGVRISGQTMDRPCSEVHCKSSGYPLQSPISPSHPLPRVTVCHHVSNGLYLLGCSTYREVFVVKLTVIVLAEWTMPIYCQGVCRLVVWLGICSPVTTTGPQATIGWC